MVDLLDRYRVFVGQVNPDLKRKQEERKNNIPSKSILSGAFNTAFPKASVILGGQDEINRRANIYNSGTPMAPPKMVEPRKDTQPNNPSQPSITQLPVAPADQSILSPGIVQATSPVATLDRGPLSRDVAALLDYRQQNFKDAQVANIAALDKLKTNPNNPTYRKDLLDSEAQVADARNSLLTAQGPLERRVYTTVEGTASGVVPQGKQRGGFVGAPTDAIAARNLQDRLEQDNAAHAIAQSTDRAIEASRDTRAERLGIPRNTLDAIEGRSNSSPSLPTVPTQTSPFSQPGDSYGDEVLRRDQLIRDINNPRASKTDRQAAINTYNSYLDDAKNNTAVQIASLRENKAQAINPVDVQKFLLDRERFGWQQGIDQKRLALQAEDAGSKAEINRLNQQKYNDEARTKFLNDFSYPDKNVSPQQSSELEALAWQLSQSTNAAIPPEVMIGYLQKAAQNNNVDWEDAPPKSLVALGEAAMRLARNDYK